MAALPLRLALWLVYLVHYYLRSKRSEAIIGLNQMSRHEVVARPRREHQIGEPRQAKIYFSHRVSIQVEVQTLDAWK